MATLVVTLTHALGLFLFFAFCLSFFAPLLLCLFPADLESKADDGHAEDKSPQDQPAEEVNMQCT